MKIYNLALGKREEEPENILTRRLLPHNTNQVSEAQLPYLKYNYHISSIMTQAQPTASVVSGSRVLVTGITGFIATHIAKQFLARGYRVRGTVRDLTKAAWLTDELFKDETSKGALELIRVPDMTAPGAYTAALKDISIVIDTVMPWPNSQDPDACIAATVASSQSLLEAALAEKAVKRVVVTSSLVAASMFQAGTTEVVGRDTYNEMAEKILESLPSDAGELREFIAYCVAKTHAEKALWKFVNERRPAFSVSTVNAGMVLGKPLNAAHMGRSAVVHPSGIVTDLFVNGVAGGNLGKCCLLLLIPWSD